jgi:hypothetical protein
LEQGLDIHQYQKTHDAIEQAERSGVEASSVGLEILDLAWPGLLMAARNRKQLG